MGKTVIKNLCVVLKDVLLNFTTIRRNSDCLTCNVGDTPTFRNSIREEVLDLTLSSITMEEKIRNWKVSEVESQADHSIIEFEVEISIDRVEEKYRNIRWTRWVDYRERLSYEINSRDEEDIEEVDELADHISNSIRQAYISSCSESRRRRKFKVKWWSAELETLKRESNRCRKEYRRRPTEENRIRRNRAGTEYKEEMRKAKSRDWKKFRGEMEKLSAVARLHRLMRMGKMNKVGTLKRENNSYMSTPTETLEELMSILFPEVEQGTGRIEINEYGNGNERMARETIEKIVNEKTVTAAIREMDPFKSPGLDGFVVA